VVTVPESPVDPETAGLSWLVEKAAAGLEPA
jgi:hypothetical protein